VSLSLTGRGQRILVAGRSHRQDALPRLDHQPQAGFAAGAAII